MRDFGLLLLRLFAGASLASHGAQKLFGWFGGGGLDATGKIFEEHLGYSPGKRYALMAARSEMASGALIAAGALVPAASAVAVSTMIVAAAAHAENGFFATDNGFELPASYAVINSALALTGPGAYSIDHLMGTERFYTPAVVLPALAGGIIGACMVLSQRQPQTKTTEGDRTS
jgi:putative oxidoreductase